MSQALTPPEDVFVGYVCTVHGGFRAFPGLISYADFILERLLKFLQGKENLPGVIEACDAATSLLRLSDCIASRLQLPRYYADSEPVDNGIELPEDQTMSAHTKAIVFTAGELAEIGVSMGSLEVFLLVIYAGRFC